MNRSVRALLVVEAVVAVGILAVGTAAGWTASDYTTALLVVCAVAVFTTVAMLGRGGTTSRSGGAMTDPISRGSVRGTPAAALAGIEIAVDVDASAEPDVLAEPAIDARRFPLVPAGLAVATGLAALISWLAFE